MKMKQLIIFILIFSFASIVEAQVKGGSILNMEELKQMQGENLLEKSMTQQKESLPVGNIVNPDTYYVGPGDIFLIYAAPQFPVPQPIIVSPTNVLMIPRIGEVAIDNKTLSELNDTLQTIFSAINPDSKVQLSLYQSRICLVNIQGNVLFPSTYTLPGSYKISTAILFANQIQTTQIPIMQVPALMKLQENEREKDKLFSESGIAARKFYSRRNIRVLHKDGSSTEVDLEKAIALKDDKYDPHLREGDVIIVPFERDNFAKISISGAVHRPVVLPYKTGDKASYLLSFAYGPSENADLNNIYLNLPQSNRNIKLGVNDNWELITADYDLEPGSTIIVGYKPQPEYNLSGVVSVQGEVNQPGIFLINEGKTKVTDVLKSAGGIKNTAYLPLARIVRRDDNQTSAIDPRRETFEIYQYSNLVLEDTVRYFIDMQYKKPIVSIDFKKLLIDSDFSEDAQLRDGDMIVFPANPRKVYVFGQVNKPGYVEYVEGQSMDWYVQKAGNYGQNADIKRASVIRGSNYIWIDGSIKGTVVYAGDMVYVPSPPAFPPSERQARYAFYSSVVGAFLGALGLVLTIVNISKK